MLQAQSNVVFVAPGGAGDGSSWSSPMGDIQKAIALAGEDRENVKDVWIQAGTYSPTQRLNLKDSVNVYGGFAGTETTIEERVKVDGGNAWDFKNQTIINGGDSIACMAAAKAMLQPIVVDGITFEHGAALSAKSDNGGGIRLNVNVTLQNSIVRNCFSNNAGGAVQIYPAGDVYNCLFENNRQTTGSNGGGAINSNTSSNGYEVHIEGCVFVGNSSTVRGGAINCQGQSAYYINACTFYNNKAVAENGTSLLPGGAIYDNGGQMSHITNCAIYNNTGSNVVYLKANQFSNNTVVKNVGGLYVAAGMKGAEVINNIVWACATDAAGTTATSLSGNNIADMRVLYNYTYNPVPTDKNWILSVDESGENTNKQFYSNQTNGDSEVQEGTDPGDKLTSGPKFRRVVDFIGAIPTELTESEIQDFRLQLDSVDLQLSGQSPLVNAGMNLDYVTTDRNGANRPQGALTDVGAYELGYYTVLIGKYDAEQGAVYDEAGNTIAPEATLTVAHGEELYLFFLTAEANPAYKLTMTTSTDGGLTYTGPTTDITANMDETGILRMPIYESCLIDVEWEQAQAVEKVEAQSFRVFSVAGGIGLSGLDSTLPVAVYDANGRVVYTQTASATTMTIGLPSGLYIVRQGGATGKAVVR